MSGRFVVARVTTPEFLYPVELSQKLADEPLTDMVLAFAAPARGQRVDRQAEPEHPGRELKVTVINP
jgi:hypothetical protein